jgi:hypothetical protein
LYECTVSADAGRYYYTTLNDSNAKRALQGAVNARSMLEYGFTTVRDVGNEGNYACVEVRRMINSGEIDARFSSPLDASLRHTAPVSPPA